MLISNLKFERYLSIYRSIVNTNHSGHLNKLIPQQYQHYYDSSLLVYTLTNNRAERSSGYTHNWTIAANANRNIIVATAPLILQDLKTIEQIASNDRIELNHFFEPGRPHQPLCAANVYNPSKSYAPVMGWARGKQGLPTDRDARFYKYHAKMRADFPKLTTALSHVALWGSTLFGLNSLNVKRQLDSADVNAILGEQLSINDSVYLSDPVRTRAVNQIITLILNNAALPQSWRLP